MSGKWKAILKCYKSESALYFDADTKLRVHSHLGLEAAAATDRWRSTTEERNEEEEDIADFVLTETPTSAACKGS